MAYSKGQIITMNLDGTDREYRILKIDGNIAEVVCMSTVGDSRVGSNNTYAGSALDTYLNSTWYNTLTAAAKAAIVSKTFNQDSWYWGTSGSPVYSGHYGTTVPGTGSYSLSKGSATYGAQITRNVYALSVQDVIDYITDTAVGDGKLENYNIWKMFWNTTTQPSISELPWLRSADADPANSNNAVWRVRYNLGNLMSENAGMVLAVRPALTIDLSKIFPPQLDAPQNVTASGTVVSFDPVQNATSYAVLADGNEIGTVQASTTTIAFTISGISYQAEEGMTWEQWVNSSYNANRYYDYYYYGVNLAFIFCREEGQQKTVAKSNNELVDGVLTIEPNTDYIHMVYPSITIVNNGTIALAVWNSTNEGEPAGGDSAGDRHILSPGEQITISSYPKNVPRLPLLYVNLEAWGGAIPMLTNSDIDVTEGVELIKVVNFEIAYLKVRIDGTITARPYDGD